MMDLSASAVLVFPGSLNFCVCKYYLQNLDVMRGILQNLKYIYILNLALGIPGFSKVEGAHIQKKLLLN